MLATEIVRQGELAREKARGRRIVEQEQQGASRAAYGKLVVEEVATRLTAEFGKGYSKSNLEYMRRFYTTYRDRYPSIAQTVSGQSSAVPPLTPRSTSPKPPFALGWSHYVLLMGIGDSDERAFYEIEAVENGWSIRELKRQVNSGLYERLALSRNKSGIRKLAREGQAVATPHDLLKNPMSWSFSDSMKRPPIRKLTWSRPSLTSLSISCWNSARGFSSKPARSGSRSTRITFSWTSSSTTGCSDASC